MDIADFGFQLFWGDTLLRWGGGQLTCPGQEQHSETTSKDGVCNLSMMDQNQSYLLINHSMRAPPFVHRVEICQKST